MNFLYLRITNLNLSTMSYFALPVIFLLGFFVLLLAFFIVKQQSAAIIERFGKFQSIRHSGLQLKIPLIDRVAGRLSLKIQQLDVIVETKTLDDVFVRLKILFNTKLSKKRFTRHFISWITHTNK